MKSKERTKASGEVFTPRSLIHQMLEKLPNEVWFDPFKTWLEPSAGDGNFLVEIKNRLLQAGHEEKHILDHMIYGIELIDDNHWVLQHRLGYFKDGKPNSTIWNEQEIQALFKTSKIHPLTQDLNQRNPYHLAGLCEADEVVHHRNMVCWSALEYDMSFGRTKEQQAADEKLRAILSKPLKVTVTGKDIERATERAKVFKDHPDFPRTPARKFAQALMEIAEKPFYDAGLPRAGEYKDVDCRASSLLPGIVDIKVVGHDTLTSSIQFDSELMDYMAVYERHFSYEDISVLVDLGELEGSEIEFTLREIVKVTK